MKLTRHMLQPGRVVIHILFWLFAYTLLTYIYGTAYNSFLLGAVVIGILFPVHIAYYYLLTVQVLPAFFEEKYVQVIIKTIFIMAGIAVLYRMVEIFMSDPYIYRYYKERDAAFNWSKVTKSWWLQLEDKGDFVNAIERSNVVVWIGITLKLFAMWHERKNVVLQAELSALKAQLHPHFLFNALNNLYALSLNNAPKTPEIILGLSNILRYVIYECAVDTVSLQRDVEILKDYIRLEQLRYEERLDLNLDIDNDLQQWQIAPLMLLPLVENAFKHGVSETIDKPWINIEIKVLHGILHVKISNSKPDHNAGARQPGNIGLSNVQNRLAILYRESHALHWFDEADCFILELTITLSTLQTA
ncbi:MAG: histidine kinase [Agriterribacter sp.]